MVKLRQLVGAKCQYILIGSDKNFVKSPTGCYHVSHIFSQFYSKEPVRNIILVLKSNTIIPTLQEDTYLKYPHCNSLVIHTLKRQ